MPNAMLLAVSDPGAMDTVMMAAKIPVPTATVAVISGEEADGGDPEQDGGVVENKMEADDGPVLEDAKEESIMMMSSNDCNPDDHEERNDDEDNGDDEDDENNIGHKLLVKQGWQSGQGLGKTLQGRVDPLPIHVEEKQLGYGRNTVELAPADGTTERRRVLECERAHTTQLEEKYKRNQEAQQARDNSLAQLKASFYCDLCDKQYLKHSDWDNHIQSYDHAHKQRLKELKQKELGKLCNKRHKEEKQLEKEMIRINEFATARQDRSGSEEAELPLDPMDADNITMFYGNDSDDAPPLPPPPPEGIPLPAPIQESSIPLPLGDPLHNIPLPELPDMDLDDFQNPEMDEDDQEDDDEEPPELDIPLPKELAPIPSDLPPPLLEKQEMMELIIPLPPDMPLHIESTQPVTVPPPVTEKLSPKHVLPSLPKPAIISSSKLSPSRNSTVSFSFNKKSSSKLPGASVFRLKAAEKAAERKKKLAAQRAKQQAEAAEKVLTADGKFEAISAGTDGDGSPVIVQEGEKKLDSDLELAIEGEAGEGQFYHSSPPNHCKTKPGFPFLTFVKSPRKGEGSIPEDAESQQEQKAAGGGGEKAPGAAGDKAQGDGTTQGEREDGAGAGAAGGAGDSGDGGDKDKGEGGKQQDGTATGTAGVEENSSSDLLNGFLKVLSVNDKELEWPTEMVQHTKTTPSITFSCNPLAFDFASLCTKPTKEKKEKSKDKKKKKGKHGRKKKGTKKKEDGEAKKDGEEGTEETGEKKKKRKKKKGRKKKGKKVKEEDKKVKDEEKKVKDEDKKVEKKEGEEKEEESEKENEEKGKKKRKKKNKVKKKKAETESESETDDEKKEGVNEEKVEEGSAKKKRKYRKKQAAEGEESDGSEKEEKTKKKRKSKKKKKKGVVNDGQGKEDGKGVKRSSDGVSEAVVKKAKVHANAEDGGRVSDFEGDKVKNQNETAKSKWDTSSESETEGKKTKKQAVVQSTPVKASESQRSQGKISSVRSAKDESARSHTAKSEDAKSEVRSRKDSEMVEAEAPRRRRNSSHHDYSDYSSSEHDHSSDDSRSRSHSYSTDSDYDRSRSRSYRSRSRSHRGRRHSYSSYSDDDYARSRSRSYSRSRRSRRSRDRSYRRRRHSKRSYSRSYTRSRSRSYTRSRSRSKSYRSRSRSKSHSRDYRRQMKPSPDKQFSSVLPKKEPRAPRKSTDKHPPKLFDAKLLVAPMPSVSNKEENSAKAQELLSKVKDKGEKVETDGKKSGVIAANVPAAGETGPVLPLIGPMSAPPKRKINLLDGDRQLPDSVLQQEQRRKQAIESILAKQRERELEEQERKMKEKELAEIPEPPASTIPMPKEKKTTGPGASNGKGKEFIGPVLPSSHPMAHTQDIPLPAKKEDRFQPIGPNDPLVFKMPLPPAQGSSRPPLPPKDKEEETSKAFIPPQLDERYKALQEQAKKHIRKKLKEDGIIDDDSEEEKEEENAESLLDDLPLEVEEGQLQLTEEMMTPQLLQHQLQLSPHTGAVPLSMVQIPSSVQMLTHAAAAQPAIMAAGTGLPQAGAPMVVVSHNSALMAAQAQAAAAAQQQQQQQIALQNAQLNAQAIQQQGQLMQTPQGLVRVIPSSTMLAAQMQQQAQIQQAQHAAQVQQAVQIQQAAQLQQAAQIQQAQLQQAQLQQLAAAQGFQLQPQFLQTAQPSAGIIMGQPGAQPMLIRVPRHPHL